MAWNISRRTDLAMGGRAVKAMAEGIEPIRIPSVPPRPRRVRPPRRAVAFLENKKRYWLYQAPAKYASPKSEEMMAGYFAFPAYGPGSGNTGNGSSGGGGGWGWSGSEGGSGGFPMDPLTWVFAAFLSLGGLVAYLKKKSAKSLLTGLSAAGVLAGSMILQSSQPALAARMRVATVGVLTLLMGARFVSNPGSLPAGLVTAISLFMGIGYAKGL